MTWAIIAAVCAGLYGLHRLALWAEGRGWIYYLRRRASADALGNAFLNLQKIVEPQAGHVVEVRRRERAELSESGDGGAGAKGEAAGYAGNGEEKRCRDS